MRRGWTIPAILQHTYYQLKYVYEEDVKSDREHYYNMAVSTRAAGTDEKGWKKYCKQVGA